MLIRTLEPPTFLAVFLIVVGLLIPIRELVGPLSLVAGILFMYRGAQIEMCQRYGAETYDGFFSWGLSGKSRLFILRSSLALFSKFMNLVLGVIACSFGISLLMG